MLRNLNATLPDGRRVMGDPHVGLLGSVILAATTYPSGLNGCLVNDGIDPLKRYRLFQESAPPSGNFILYPDGSGSADANGLLVYRVEEDNVNVAASEANRTITIYTPSGPQIVTQPGNQTGTIGGSATFAVLATGIPSPTYQWRRAGVDLPGAVSSSYVLSPLSGPDNGVAFTVAVTNSEGTVVSNAATLTLATAAAISSQPQGSSRYVGQTATFNVVGQGTAPLAYQWKKDGVDIPGANSATYVTGVLSLLDNGSVFTVQVSNAFGTVLSGNAGLSVTEAPVAAAVTTPPSSQSVVEGGSATFTVVAQGTAPVTYQWRKNGADIPGAVSSTLLLTGVALSQNGEQYSCFVQNAYGQAVSSPALLTVTSATVAPQITLPPQSTTVNEGAPAFFSVAATGTAPLSYQWLRNGIDIVGATQSSYALGVVVPGDNGVTISCRVTNPLGSVTSQVALLTVIDLPEPTEYPLDLAEWPRGRVVRPTSGAGFTAWPMDVDDVEFFAFDFSTLIGSVVIEDVSVTVTPFYPMAGGTPEDYVDGDFIVHGNFVVQRLRSPGTLGRHVVRCTARTASGGAVTLPCTLYILRKGQPYIR